MFGYLACSTCLCVINIMYVVWSLSIVSGFVHFFKNIIFFVAFQPLAGSSNQQLREPMDSPVSGLILYFNGCMKSMSYNVQNFMCSNFKTCQRHFFSHYLGAVGTVLYMNACSMTLGITLSAPSVYIKADRNT